MIAASTTWPTPGRARVQQRAEHAEGEVERAAAEVADAGSPAAPACRPARRQWSAPEIGEVVDVVPGGVGVAARTGPSRSSGRRPAPGCARGTRPGRGRAAPSRRAGSPRSAPRTPRPAEHLLQPVGDLRSTWRASRPRSSTGEARPASPLARGRSIRTTSAPRSASIIPAKEIGPIPAISTTFTPCKGPMAVETNPPWDPCVRSVELAGSQLVAELGAADLAADRLRELLDEVDLARVLVGRGEVLGVVL